MTAPPVAGGEHQPDAKTYDCRACAQQWPCDASRMYLMASTPDAVQLAIRLWDELERAAGVLFDVPPRLLFERFLKWSR